MPTSSSIHGWTDSPTLSNFTQPSSIHENRRMPLLLLLAPPAAFAMQGSPPHFADLRKVGKGHSARWEVGDFDHEGAGSLSIAFMCDRHPSGRCLKLEVWHDTGMAGRQKNGNDASRRMKRLGNMLLESRDGGSALRGMRLHEQWRGQGLSSVLLAIWLQLCLVAGVRPCTNVINKPLLGRALSKFGFVARNGGGVPVAVSAAVRYRDCAPVRVDVAGLRDHERPGSAETSPSVASVRVRTPYVLPDTRAADEFLAFKVDSVLSGRLRLDASAGALRRALTLDDASREAELPGAPSPRVPQSAAGACFTEL